MGKYTTYYYKRAGWFFITQKMDTTFLFALLEGFSQFLKALLKKSELMNST